MNFNIYYTLRKGLKIVVFKIEITAPSSHRRFETSSSQRLQER